MIVIWSPVYSQNQQTLDSSFPSPATMDRFFPHSDFAKPRFQFHSSNNSIPPQLSPPLLISTPTLSLFSILYVSFLYIFFSLSCHLFFRSVPFASSFLRVHAETQDADHVLNLISFVLFVQSSFFQAFKIFVIRLEFSDSL